MGGTGPIPSLAILHLCEAYDGAIEDFEKVLKLDELLFKPDGGDEGEQKQKQKKEPKAVQVKRKR